ncbi:DUF1572 domain-containing protein [Planomicrobium sp. CPCC 101110]|uniref:DUF1572 domain-containing protein n=1 Tax=Planomicrobium sp. CPCC 101110 TaxID=2599619 RepID=UPI0011B3F4F8|nr:DUF1572 domain-containing protein [Planomicrobium sp. CPCC 101110]TWT25280.1 DUF1572 domain-containing protein [Planomicrobium sp. CPCC 101110]
MENILLAAAVLVILLVALFVYFRSRKAASSDDEEIPIQESEAEIEESEPDIEDPMEEDPYEQFVPRVWEVQNEEAVKERYRKIEIPAILKLDLLRTLEAGARVIQDSKTYKVEFSPEVVKGLKDKSMNLIEKVDGKGYLPAVKKEGVKGIYAQATLVKKIDPKLVAHASFNLLTAVVGQQQLIEIQSSLKGIEGKLDVLLQNRDNDFAGKAEARFSYFREVIGRFRSNGIMLGGVEDQKVEDLYTATLQDLKVLNKDLNGIGESIDRLKEHEVIRKWGEAAIIKDYKRLIETFNNKQELVLLNIKFIEECYEPYLTAVRNYQEENSRSQTLDEVIAENNKIIGTIESKVEKIEENYKVKLHFGVKALKYRNLEGLKEVAPLKINQQKVLSQEVPSELLFEMTGEEKVYAYVPK